MIEKIPLISPVTLAPLIMQENSWFAPTTGEEFPIINGVPRFVRSNDYATSFGLQWNKFRKTQLDSYTGVPLSKDRLTRIAGGSLDIFKGKNVLEAGCGAGRFTEIMLNAGANVWAVDLSVAVDANYENCKGSSSYFVCQANILSLPFPPEQFDIVVCVGVIQHTPDPEKTMETLCSHVNPGGILLLDHYPPNYPMPESRRFLRTILLKTPEKLRMSFVKAMVAMMWPIHEVVYKNHGRGFWWLRRQLLKFSPVVDYQYAYPQLGRQLLYQWAILDTHDTLTDYYKHLRSADEVSAHLTSCGMIDVFTQYAGNGVEARARKKG
jgi:SAM-dependent methyltransferase